MKFIDQAFITVRSGKGGHGAVHFRREKFVPRGGPDGGDGGRGGDVWLVASNRARSLYDYHHRRMHRAEDGRPGADKGSTGRSGAHLELTVPPGTQVFDEDSGELLADLTDDGDRVCLAEGGNGGWGNARFKSSTRQAPDRANPGLPGKELRLRLELKLLADVALVGFPNAGKSTLIRAVSASRARVADYPFTTLVPNLGVVRHHDRSYTVADVPGLIEGAADGAGLGHRFLRHIERCELMVFVLSVTDDVEHEEALETLRRELAAFDPALAERPSVVTLNKVDVLGPDAPEATADLEAAIGEPVVAISAATGDGVKGWLDRVTAALPKVAPKLKAQASAVYDPLAE